jgi:hypothetical protein
VGSDGAVLGIIVNRKMLSSDTDQTYKWLKALGLVFSGQTIANMMTYGRQWPDHLWSE